MRKIVIVVMLAVFASMSLTEAAPARAQAQESDPAEMEREFVARINDLRASKGLPALTLHDELVAKAQRWSATMAADGDIRHSDLPDGITAPWRRVGENVGMGGSVRALHDAFVASPHHYENLVDPGFNHVGIGVVVDGNGTIFVSQEFMDLAPAPAPTAPPPSSAQADGIYEASESGTAVSFRLTDPVPAPTPAGVKGDARPPAPPVSSPDRRQGDGSSNKATGAAVSGDSARAVTMRLIVFTMPAQSLAVAAIILLAGVASVLRRVAARRAARAVRAG